MADISTALITYLKTISNVTDLIGAGTAARIYHDEIPPKAAEPFVRIEWFGGDSEEALADIVGVAFADVQIDAYATTTAGAYDLAEKIRLAPLQKYTGGTWGSVTVESVTSEENYRRGKDSPEGGDHDPRYWCSRDYRIEYNEATS